MATAAPMPTHTSSHFPVTLNSTTMPAHAIQQHQVGKATATTSHSQIPAFGASACYSAQPPSSYHSPSSYFVGSHPSVAYQPVTSTSLPATQAQVTTTTATYPKLTSFTRGPYSTQHHSEVGTYRPLNAEYVPPGSQLSGGMVPTYDMSAVPTFEAPLALQTSPYVPQYDMQERGVSSMEESFQKGKKRIQKKTKKPHKKGWCC